jgi:uncharacterized protein YjbI with pentapeptide repeats
VTAERAVAKARFDWVKQLGTSVTTLTALGALIFTGLALQESRTQNSISEQGQITGRYSSAVDQLGSANQDVRLGGVYALERIMRNSPPDQPTIVEVLSAFIRNHPPGLSASSPTNAPLAKPPTDISAVLTVLGRRDRAFDQTSSEDLRDVNFRGLDLNVLGETSSSLTSGLGGVILRGADLRGADLTGANLNNADLADAQLVSARLTGAFLFGTDLTGANLFSANLDTANMGVANLTGAILISADLNNADLGNAVLTGADLSNAILDDADLYGAHLEHANLDNAYLMHAVLSRAALSQVNLTGAHLTGADFWDTTMCNGTTPTQAGDYKCTPPPG